MVRGVHPCPLKAAVDTLIIHRIEHQLEILLTFIPSCEDLNYQKELEVGHDLEEPDFSLTLGHLFKYVFVDFRRKMAYAMVAFFKEPS
jgi:hypothetical protein